MGDVLYLAWRYLAHNRVKTTVLVASIMLIGYLPAGLRVLVAQSAAELTARAEATPLLVGARGSALELVLSSLYFESDPPELTSYAESLRVSDSGLATAIPLYVRFRVQRQPIVGTSLEYLSFRGLHLARGRRMAMLGECVLGSEAARSLGVDVGDTVISSPESVFDVAGVYPLKMPVVGVLAPSHTPDDQSVFVDLKTAWVIEGLVHGHQDMSRPEAASGVLSRDGSNIVANASVMEYNEITPDNIDSFHFHGEAGEYPVSAVIAVPHDAKSQVILMGRYQAPDESQQIVRPASVMDDLLDTVVTVQSFVVAGMMLVGAATLAVSVLVFLLSLRIRRREIATMVKIGGSRGRIVAVLATEVLLVLVSAGVLAGALTSITSRFGSAAIRSLLLS
jgi:putative ABC transport system permease protein